MTSPLRVPSARTRAAVLVAWSVALAVLLLGPALGGGFVLSYDMVWVPDLAVRSDVWGLGSGLPRAVPSDAVVAVLDEILPGVVLQKLALVAAVVGGGLGAARLVPAHLAVQLTAVSLWQWNAFLVERLVLGHWPVLIGYAVLPWLLLAARRWRLDGRLPAVLLPLAFLGSLSASAGLATAAALVAAAGGRARWRALALLVGVANGPWVVAGLLHAGAATTDASGAEVFALRSEGAVPAPLAALTLGGVWNTEVVPDSRAGVLGWVTLVVLVALAAAGVRPWRRAAEARDRRTLLVLWGVGWALAVVTWAAPGLTAWLVAHVPGGGLLRDGGRLLLLCAPLVVVLVAHGAHRVLVGLRTPAARAGAGLGAVLLPVALLPDGALGAAGRLDAVAFPASYEVVRDAVADAVAEHPGDVLLLPASSYRQPGWNGDRKVLDPLARYLTPDVVASDVLVVSGVEVEGEDPRFREVEEALTAPSSQERAARLAALGISVVVVDGSAPGVVPAVASETVAAAGDLRAVRLADVTQRRVPAAWAAVMTPVWVAYWALPLVGAGLAAVRARRRRHGRRHGR